MTRVADPEDRLAPHRVERAACYERSCEGHDNAVEKSGLGRCPSKAIRFHSKAKPCVAKIVYDTGDTNEFQMPVLQAKV